MKTRIFIIAAMLAAFFTNVIGQSRFRPDPDPGTQVTLTEKVTTLLPSTETVFGAEFEYTAKGAVITFIYPNTPAETYNFRKGDIITAIGSTTINSESAYRQAMNDYKPEQSVVISYIRKDTQKQKKVILDKITVYKKPVVTEE